MIDWDSCVLWLDSKYFSESKWWDRSRYCNNGDIYGAKWKNDAFYFDGSDDYIDCGNHESLNITDDLSIVLWVDFVSVTGVDGQGLVGHKDYDNWMLYAYNADLYFKYINTDNNAQYLYAENVLNAGLQHVGFTWNDNSKTGKFYVNGSYKESNTSTGSIRNTGFKELLIGAVSSTSRLLKGKLYNVMVFEKTLSSEEIQILCNLMYRRV